MHRGVGQTSRSSQKSSAEDAEAQLQPSVKASKAAKGITLLPLSQTVFSRDRSGLSGPIAPEEHHTSSRSLLPFGK